MAAAVRLLAVIHRRPGKNVPINTASSIHTNQQQQLPRPLRMNIVQQNHRERITNPYQIVYRH